MKKIESGEIFLAQDISSDLPVTKIELPKIDLAAELANYSAEERTQIEAAYDRLAKKNPAAAEKQARVAKILAERCLDATAICAAFLYNIIEDLENFSPQETPAIPQDARLIARSVARITTAHQKNTSRQEADATRKMIFALADDARVILVKIAEKLDTIRNAGTLPENERRAVAAEVLDIWAPLADRLGLKDEKNEFEDLSLKFSNQDVYQQIKKIVAQKKQERKNYLGAAVQKIQAAATAAHIDISIKSRAKHFYSIYQKMRKRNVEAADIYDLLAIRVICQTKAECYTLVGLVHELWQPIDGKFKDYIACPKKNGYQSLHTTVLCEGQRLEIQIRTQAMHDKAEHGVASHWLYKKGKSHDTIDESNLEVYNKIKTLGESRESANAGDGQLFAQIKKDLLGHKIYVFTPQNKVIELPEGATAIDFAYKIHSAVGEKIVAAKANGKIIPLSEPLQNTQTVEILTNPQAHPTESHLENARTQKARQKIKAWLVANGLAERLAKTPEEIEAHKEAARLAQEKGERQAQKHKFAENDSAAAAGGSGGAPTKIRICDTTNFLITFAQCCRPKKGDAIAGYVSRTRGITIHRADCRAYLSNPNKDARSVEVEWAGD